MRILFDSKQPNHKDPFGTLIPGQECRLNIYIPANLRASEVSCVLTHQDGSPAFSVPMAPEKAHGVYEVFSGVFSFREPGLYFYYFRITAHTGPFRLFKQGDDTNMEAGDLWQISCVPEDFTVPDWAQGGTMYQIFPDRFFKSGECDLTDKLTPYTVHKTWNEEVQWQPTPLGEVLNNDFYGGNFQGITEKMDYIASLGVTVLYLNPINKSFSSHRYDTGDYKTPDPMLGTEADFTALCDAAHRRGIRVILDGVYSHTGSNSLYFNRERQFPGDGAYNTQNSPYFSWYSFSHWPDRYRCWWGFDTLPTVNKIDPEFIRYIITDEDSVVAHWLRAGCDGFRLDVADELPNEFMVLIKKRIRQVKPDALLLGEVWEDASNKIAYDVRRRYFVDGILDSVMNYPFRTAILDFLRERDGGANLRQTVMTIAENYPRQVLNANMNCLSTHDSPRILTALVDDFDGSREEKARRHLSARQYEIARERRMMAAFLQYTLPGMPSIYYADEAGMEGYKDPFNRRPYPWGREDGQLLDHFRVLGRIRRENMALRLGDIAFFQAGDQKLGFTRKQDGKTLRIYVNRSCEDWAIPGGKLLLGRNLHTVAPQWLTLAPMGWCITED